MAVADAVVDGDAQGLGGLKVRMQPSLLPVSIQLPRALRTLAHEPRSPRTGLTLWAGWEPSPPDASVAVLASRATGVPQAAVASGIQGTVTVTPTGLFRWTLVSDPGRRDGGKLHGMQGVTLWIGLASALRLDCAVTPEPVAATATPRSAAWSDQPPRVARSRACPGQPGHGGGY
jgi:hypothetical protein